MINNSWDWENHKMKQVLAGIRKMKRLNASTRIDRKNKFPFKLFLKNYLAENKPVLLRQMITDWPALNLWSPNYFKENYGEVKIEIMSNRAVNARYEIDRDAHRYKIKLGDYITMLEATGNSNSNYITANNEALSINHLNPLFNDMRRIPEYTSGDYHKGNSKLWFGPGGTITPLHHDNTNILLVQIYGTKSIKMIPSYEINLLYNFRTYYSAIQDLENYNKQQFPLISEANILEVTLQPGDILFIPIFWWHYVKSLTTSISLSLTNITNNIYINNNEDVI